MGFWVANYVIDFIGYYIVYRWIFHVPLQKKLGLNLGVTLGACLLVALTCHGELGYEPFVIIFIALLEMLVLAKKNRVTTSLLFPIVFFIVGAVNILGSYLMSIVFNVPYSVFTAHGYGSLLSESFFPFVFFILALFFKRLREEGEMVSFSSFQYMIALLGTGCMFIVIAVSQGVMQGETSFSDWTSTMSVSLVIVGIIFVVLLLFQMSIEKHALQYKMENEYYQLALKKQEAHINEIVESDQKIRRFRHDVNAHLTALEQCIQTNDLEQLKSYVERMRAETRKYEVKKFTGVGAVDAIISEWYQKAVDEGIAWEWDGSFPDKTELEIFDLCVIFSNLLSNAVEAARQVEEGRERKIQISCGSFRNRICIRISNTCRQDLEKKSQYGTTKSDFKNHGFGLLNIQNTVDKVHGEFRRNADQGVFNAEILL